MFGLRSDDSGVRAWAAVQTDHLVKKKAPLLIRISNPIIAKPGVSLRPSSLLVKEGIDNRLDHRPIEAKKQSGIVSQEALSVLYV